MIREYWENQAQLHGASHAASWGDSHAISLEIDTIAKHIKDGDSVLDVGCANGYSALRQMWRNQVKRLVGVDFSPAMIATACEEKGNQGFGSSVEFRIGDARALEFKGESFDVVYTTRTLINLPSWDEQKQAIGEALRVCKRGGTVILCEAFWEPLCALNALRAVAKLPPLVEHDFNRYLKKSKLESLLRAQSLEFFCEEFSGVYYIGSRFLRELATDVNAWPGYTNPINELFRVMEREYSADGFGIQQAYVVSK